MQDSIYYIGKDLKFHEKPIAYVEPVLADVAISGSYLDLSNTPSIPNMEASDELLTITL